MPFLSETSDDLPPIRLRQAAPKWFQILTPFRYRDPTNGTVYVVPAHDENAALEKGNRTDLASVPPPLWGFFASYGHQTRPALLHDRLCEEAELVGERKDALAFRTEADRVFRVALAEEGVPGLRCWMFWTAVTLGTYAAYAKGRLALLLGHVFAALGCFYAAAFRLDARDALLVAALPALASALWGRTWQAPLVGSYAAPLALAVVVVQYAVLVVVWVPSLVAWVVRFLRSGRDRSRWPLPRPVPYQRF